MLRAIRPVLFWVALTTVFSCRVSPPVSADAGSPIDAGVPADGGGSPDGGVIVDGGPGPDGGVILDGGAPDGGVIIDGGVQCLGEWAGDRQQGTVGADEVLALALDESGRVLLAGYEGGVVGQTNIEPSGNAEGFVARYSPDGTEDWRTVVSTGSADTVEALLQRKSGSGITVAGRTMGVLAGTSSAGHYDAFVADLDGEGRIVRVVQSGDERPQHPVQLAAGTEDRLFVAGYDDLFVQHSQLIDDENGTVARFDRDEQGTLSQQWWSRAASTNIPDRLTGLAATSDGAALFVSGFKFFEDAEGPGGAFLRRLDADGHAGWQTQVAPVATEAHRVLLLPSGDVLVAGSTQLQLGEAPLGLADAYIATFNPADGLLLSAHQYGTADQDLVTAAALAPNGDIYLAGDTFGSFGGFQNQGERDLFVLHLDSSGTLVGVWQGGSTARDHMAALAIDPCGFVMVAGYTEGDLVASTRNAGSRDSFLKRLSPEDFVAPSR